MAWALGYCSRTVVVETTVATPGILSDFKTEGQTQKDTSALLTFNKCRCSDREGLFHAGASPQVVDRGPPRHDWYEKIEIKLEQQRKVNYLARCRRIRSPPTSSLRRRRPVPIRRRSVSVSTAFRSTRGISKIDGGFEVQVCMDATICWGVKSAKSRLLSSSDKHTFDEKECASSTDRMGE